jgi:hypothetical protein
MPGMRLFKNGYHVSIGANNPIIAATINLGSTRGVGSATRIASFYRRHPIQETSSPYSWNSINPITNGLGNWFQVSMSNNGEYIAAINANIYLPSIYISNNYGVSFTQNTPDSHDYASICMSNNGQIIYAPAMRDDNFYSNNYGLTFNPTQDPGGYWYKSGMNSNGTLVCIAKSFNSSGGTTPNPIFISLNSSLFNVSLDNLYYNWSGVVVNSSGSIIAVCSYDGYVYITTNSGSSWSQISLSSLPSHIWSGITMDSTGNNIAVCSLDGYIYFSSNTGTSWTKCTSPNSNNSLSFSAICISPQANVLFVCAINDYMYYSTNNGGTWTMTNPSNNPLNWSSIICNNDGSIVCACVNGGNIYIGQN